MKLMLRGVGAAVLVGFAGCASGPDGLYQLKHEAPTAELTFSIPVGDHTAEADICDDNSPRMHRFAFIGAKVKFNPLLPPLVQALKRKHHVPEDFTYTGKIEAGRSLLLIGFSSYEQGAMGYTAQQACQVAYEFKPESDAKYRFEYRFDHGSSQCSAVISRFAADTSTWVPIVAERGTRTCK